MALSVPSQAEDQQVALQPAMSTLLRRAYMERDLIARTGKPDPRRQMDLADYADLLAGR